MPEKVFVYGTLRIGDCRGGVRSFVRSLAEEAYLDGFIMLNLGGFPGIIPGEGQVRGEVHEYESLDILDQIEGYRPEHPAGGLYNRAQVEVQLPDGQAFETCWVYIFNCGRTVGSRLGDVIESGDWFEHRDLYRQLQTHRS